MLLVPLVEVLTVRLAPTAAAQSAPPSILVIQTDDMRSDDLSAMPKTRALIQATGMTFENYIAGGTPLCCPNRATALTGLYPHNTGVLTNGGPNGGHGAFTRRGNENRTIAVALNGIGYKTAYIGKYMNHYPSGRRGQVPPGWDQWHAIIMDRSCDECRGGVRGGGYYYNYRLNQNGRVRKYGTRNNDYSTNVMTREALRIIQSTPDTEPLFIWVNPMAPHGPPVPGPGHTRKAVPRGFKTPAFNRIGAGKALWINRLPRMKRELVSYVNKFNVGRRRTLLAVDDMVAKLVPEMPPGSWVFFFSDNGYMLGEFRIPTGKVVPYRPSLEVPLLVSGPLVTPGSTSASLVSTIDLASTWAAIAGIPTLPWSVDGVSFLPVLTPSDPDVGPPTPRDSVLVSWLGSTNASAVADLDGDVLPAALLTPAPAPAPAETTVEAERKKKKKPNKKRPNKKKPGKKKRAPDKRRRPEAPDKDRYRPDPYYALRGADWLYIEWAGGNREYYSHITQPFELNNEYDLLSPQRKLDLALRVQTLRICSGANCTIPPTP